MTKEQEAQQAQTIARIKQEYERHSGRTYHAFTDFAPLVTELYANLSVLLEIVDSQAQKIEQQDADIANLLNKLANWPATYERQEQKIAEQAKEIERLKEQVKVTARQVHDAAQLRL